MPFDEAILMEKLKNDVDPDAYAAADYFLENFFEGRIIGPVPLHVSKHDDSRARLFHRVLDADKDHQTRRQRSMEETGAYRSKDIMDECHAFYTYGSLTRLLDVIVSTDCTIAKTPSVDGELPLHRILTTYTRGVALRVGFDDVAQMLAYAFDDALSVPDRNGDYPLHLAIKFRKVTEETVIECFLKRVPEAALIEDGDGMLPMELLLSQCPRLQCPPLGKLWPGKLLDCLLQSTHSLPINLAQRYQENPISRVLLSGIENTLPIGCRDTTDWVNRHWPTAFSVPDADGNLAMHNTTFLKKIGPDVLRRIIEANPKTLVHRNNDGNTILHTFLADRALFEGTHHLDLQEIAKLLVTTQNVNMPGQFAKLPVQLAIQSLDFNTVKHKQIYATILEQLKNHDPLIVKSPDHRGWLPFHYVIQSPRVFQDPGWINAWLDAKDGTPPVFVACEPHELGEDSETRVLSVIYDTLRRHPMSVFGGG